MRLSQKRLPTYTVFAKPQMLPALSQEKLNRAELRGCGRRSPAIYFSPERVHAGKTRRLAS
jgi:hypothetical protein